MPESTKLVVRITGFADGTPCLYEGMFLETYTPLEDVKGSFTDDILKAKLYPDIESFMADYYFNIGIRPDGQPNCPLTAFNCSLTCLSKGETEGSTSA